MGEKLVGDEGSKTPTPIKSKDLNSRFVNSIIKGQSRPEIRVEGQDLTQRESNASGTGGRKDGRDSAQKGQASVIQGDASAEERPYYNLTDE